jgi:hypothetical protein
MSYRRTITARAATTETGDDILGPLGDAACLCAADNPTGMNIGRVCFAAASGGQ